jgi:hypothetical protein
MSLFTKSPLTLPEHILKYSLIYLNMRKIADDKLEKIRGNDDSMKCVEDFLGEQGMHLFLFAAPSGADNIVFSLEPPDKKLMAKKCLLVLRARPPPKKDAGEPVVITPDNIDQEVIFMEINK